MAQRVTQDVNLTLAAGTPKQRVTQESVLTLCEGSPKIRVTQLATLFLIDVNEPVVAPKSIMEMCLP